WRLPPRWPPTRGGAFDAACRSRSAAKSRVPPQCRPTTGRSSGRQRDGRCDERSLAGAARTSTELGSRPFLRPRCPYRLIVRLGLGRERTTTKRSAVVTPGEQRRSSPLGKPSVRLSEQGLFGSNA